MSRIPRAVIALLTLLVISMPIALVIWQSFLDRPFFSPNYESSLLAYKFIFTDPKFYKAMLNSAMIAIGMTVIALPLGTALAYLLVRTDMPGKRVIGPLILAPMFISSIVIAFGFVVMFGPVGFASTAANDILGFVPWNIYSIEAVIIIAGLTHIPHVYLYTSASLKGVASDLDEAARVLGATTLQAARRVTIPVIRPAIAYAMVLVCFLGFELFGLPLILSEPQGEQVLATYLYGITNILGVPSYQLMAVVVVVLIVISLPLVFAQRMLLQKTERFITVRGKVGRTRQVQLGNYKWIAFALVVAWLVITVGMPIIGLALRSLVTSWGVGISIFDSLTLENYRQLATYPNVVRAITNTILLSVIGGAAAVAVYTAIALCMRDGPGFQRAILEYAVMLPRAMPGVVAGLAIFWVFLFVPILQPFRATIVSLWFAYALVWMAYGLRMISSSLMQIAPELEQGARVHGASIGQATKLVTVPLLRNSMFSAWILLIVTFIREYSTGIYLLTPGTEVIGSLMVSLWASGGVEIVVALAVVNTALVFIVLSIANLVREKYA
jgi:iron(III) transport system permease protein